MLHLHSSQDSIHELSLVLHSIIVTLDSVLFCPFHHHHFIQLHQSYWPIHFTITVAADPSIDSIHKLAVSIGHFHLFEGNVFTSQELDQVFLAVNNSNASFTHELPNITSMEPSILDINFVSLILHHVVASGNVGTTDHNFASAVDWVSFNITAISRKVRLSSFVTNIRGGYQLDFNRRNNLSGNSTANIIRCLDRDPSASFRQTITLNQRNGESGSAKVLDFRVQWPTAGKTHTKFPPNRSPELFEDQGLEERGIKSIFQSKPAPFKGSLE
mmetsp:Transcript_20551/g.44492  ORF Transcript_20551/g.44492 Transcript_20551/m.44492 type:complete len:272 (+) Transcript_20551:311-1126(+)